MSNLTFTRYTKAFKNADYKNRQVRVNTKGGQVIGKQYQSTGEVYNVGVHINEDAKLVHACDVSGFRARKLAFEIGDITIFLTAEQLDQMQAHRPDVTGESYIDITRSVNGLIGN